MPDKISRRCNGKQQRERGGRSVQLPDWFMILLSSSRHLCPYTYVNDYGSSIVQLAELHADLFSRHDSPFEVYVFVTVAKRGDEVMPDKISRRCNGKQQTLRGRGGRSVQLPDWFMILLSFMPVYVRTYYVRGYDQMYSSKKRGKAPEVRSRDRHIEHVCKISGSTGISWKRRGHLNLCAEHMCILRSCL